MDQFVPTDSGRSPEKKGVGTERSSVGGKKEEARAEAGEEGDQHRGEPEIGRANSLLGQKFEAQG